jgi:hypothetical protein
MIVVYGILNSEGVHIDTSNTLRGAKIYASLHNYSIVTKRMEYNAVVVAKKINGKWINH